MKFLARLWPFLGGDVATAHGEEPSLTMAGQLVTLPRPIPLLPLTERNPGPGDFDDLSGCCWWGQWHGAFWVWTWDDKPVRDETHWLPASAEVLPARCCPPEPQP